MKLLVVTQAVDSGDPVLGFFVQWVEEFAKHAERVEVICLKEGRHDSLPANVRVHSLGKTESSRQKAVGSRMRYVFRFLSLMWKLRHDYDAVFVHMNEEYMLLGGLFWRLAGKKVVLWRNHKMGSWRTRLAAMFARMVCYTSPEAFVSRYTNAVAMPIGIDTDFFTPPTERAPASILFLGRLDPVKRVELFIDALEKVDTPFQADIYGSPTEGNEDYAAGVVRSATRVPELTMHPSVPHERTRELYRTHAIYVNLTPSGSFDKTIGEAMANGCTVVCANEAVQDILPANLFAGETAASVATAVEHALAMSSTERAALSTRSRAYISENHSLATLMSALAAQYR